MYLAIRTVLSFICILSVCFLIACTPFAFFLSPHLCTIRTSALSPSPSSRSGDRLSRGSSTSHGCNLSRLNDISEIIMQFLSFTDGAADSEGNLPIRWSMASWRLSDVGFFRREKKSIVFEPARRMSASDSEKAAGTRRKVRRPFPYVSLCGKYPFHFIDC